MSRTLSRLKREGVIYLETPQQNLALRCESTGFSQVVTGNLGFLSSYDGDLRDLLMLPQERPVSMRVVRGLLGFLSSRSRTMSSSGADAGKSRFLSSVHVDLGVPMEFQPGSQASSLWETCKSSFLSSCNSSVRLPVELT